LPGLVDDVVVAVVAMVAMVVYQLKQHTHKPSGDYLPIL
jgi:hypothetical protein